MDLIYRVREVFCPLSLRERARVRGYKFFFSVLFSMSF
jgi:hypothetical protein